jgi:hypothetical protein
LSCRQQDTFFCRSEAAVYKRFSNVDFTAFIQVFDQLLGNAPENPLLDPLLEPPMACLVWRIPLR